MNGRECTVFSAPKVGCSVLGNTIVWRALVSTEGSDKLTGTKVVAMVTRCQEESIVPAEGLKSLRPVVDGLLGFEVGRSDTQVGEEAAWICAEQVLLTENFLNDVAVEAGDHGHLRLCGSLNGLGVLSELGMTVVVELEVLSRIDDRCHHGLAGVSASRNASVVPARVEQQLT
jgi:hypothetical protein